MLSIVIASIGYTLPAQADTVTGDSGSDKLVDLVLMRPAGLVATVVGGAVFIVGLPFTIPSGDVGESACALISRPAAYTFKRPLGDFDECNGGGCQPCRGEGSARR